MTKKQKKMLKRILIASVLMVVLAFLPVTGLLKFALYMVPYLVIGHDILRKAFLGVKNKQMFDESFLMALATVGALALGEYGEAVFVMLFYQVGEFFQDLAPGLAFLRPLNSFLYHIAVRAAEGTAVDHGDLHITLTKIGGSLGALVSTGQTVGHSNVQNLIFGELLI